MKLKTASLLGCILCVLLLLFPTILRFLDLGGATRTITVETPLWQLQQVWQTDAVERDQAQLSLPGAHQFQFTVHPHEIVAVRLITIATTGTFNHP